MARHELAAADIAWLRMEQPTNLMMITGVLTFDAPMPVDVFKALLEERLLIYDRFRQRVKGRRGTPYWEDDPHFDIDRHVHRTTLPEPAGQAELQELTSDLMSSPLDFSKPLWQMHLVESYDGGSAVVVRLHHCIGDGIALIHVMISMADEYFAQSNGTRSGREVTARNPVTRLLRPVAKAISNTVGAAEAVLDESVSLVFNPKHLLKRAKQGMSIGAATSRLLLLPSDTETVFKGELSASKQVAWSRALPLSTVKAIGHQVEAKINDVLVASVAGAVRRYLLARGEAVEHVELRATIPVNLRPLSEAHKLGNHFGLVFLTLPVHIAEPVERLLETKRRMDKLKGSAEAGVIFGLLQLAGSGPEEVQRQLVDLLGAKATAVLTNVPGPREELHLQGRAISGIMFWVPRAGNLSLGISILSYAGDVRVGVTTDAALVPDPDVLTGAFHEEFEALRKQFSLP